MISLNDGPETTLLMTFSLRDIKQSVPCSRLSNIVLNCFSVFQKHGVRTFTAHPALLLHVWSKYCCTRKKKKRKKEKKRNSSTPTITVSNTSHMTNGVSLSKDLQLADSTLFYPKYLN